MKKKVLSIVLAVCMALGLMPALSLQVSAAGADDPYFVITQGPTSVTGYYYVYEKTPGSDSFTAFAGNNADSEHTYYSALANAIEDITTVVGAEDATLEFGKTGTDSDNVTGTLAFNEEDGVRLGTSGTYTIKGSLCNSYSSALACTIRLEGASAVVDGANIAAESNVKVIYNTSCGSLTINSGTISDTTGGSIGIETSDACTGDIIINGGEIDCDEDGIYCNGSSTIDISGHDTAVRGVNYGIELAAGSTLNMEDGTVSGAIGILAKNADVELSGGTVESPDSCALIVYGGTASVSGATVTSSNSVSDFSPGSPGTVLVVTGEDSVSGEDSGDAELYVNGGSVTNTAGTGYAVYSHRMSGSHTPSVYLSGMPSVSGATADIWTDSVIYANDGTASPVSYNGGGLTMEYDDTAIAPGSTVAVRDVTNASGNLFSLTNDGYYLVRDGARLIVDKYPSDVNFNSLADVDFYEVPSIIGDWKFDVYDSSGNELPNSDPSGGGSPFFWIRQLSGTESLFVNSNDGGFLQVDSNAGEFKLNSFTVQNQYHSDDTYYSDGFNIIGYKDGSAVPGAAQYVPAAYGAVVPITFAGSVWGDIDQFRIVSLKGTAPSDSFFFYFDDLDVGAPVIDNTPPELSGCTPSDGAIGVAIDTQLSLIFSENVTAATENIYVKKTSDNSTVRTIAANSPQVSVSGGGVTINLGSNLDYDTSYYILIDGGAFEDAAHHPYVGISDKTAWNFATVSSGSSPGSPGHSSGTHTGSHAPVSNTIPVTVGGKSAPIGTAFTSADSNGQLTTTMTADNSALNGYISNAADGSSVVFTLPQNTGATAGEVSFTLQTVDDMAAKDMTLSMEWGGVTYKVPAAAIDTASAAKAFGASKLSDVTFSVTISPADSDDLAALSRSASGEGFELIGSALTFNVTASYNGQSTAIHNFGSFVSRTVKVDSGVEPGRITTAITIDPDGAVRHIPTYVYQGTDGYYYADINSMTNSTYTLIYNAAAFSDAKGKWYEAQADEMASRKILEGIAEGAFGGDKAITRAEFAAIIIRAFGLPEEKTDTFADVSGSAWYCGYVGAACRYGIVTGRSSTVFDPNANITREEAMAMIARGAMIAGCKGTAGGIGTFSDMDKVSAWASGAAGFNLTNGLIVGSGGMIRPQDTITRAETATVVLRLLQKAGLVDIRNIV